MIVDQTLLIFLFDYYLMTVDQSNIAHQKMIVNLSNTALPSMVMIVIPICSTPTNDS